MKGLLTRAFFVPGSSPVSASEKRCSDRGIRGHIAMPSASPPTSWGFEAREHLDDFVEQYRAGERHKREQSDNFRRWTYEELDKRPDFNLDVWVNVEDKSLEDAAQIPPPEVLAEEIISTVSAALSEFATAAAEFGV